MNIVDTSAEIAIIIPVFNEGENVLPLAEEIRTAMQPLGRSYEIVFVDDASTDATWERIDEARRQSPHVRGVRHEWNAGQSAALWTGLRAARSPILVTMDGDRQNDPADVPKLLQELDNADFVCGVRAKRNDAWLRRVSTKVARAARRQVLGVDFCDTGCALRAFKQEVLDGVFPFDGVHRFLPLLVHANGARAKEIPIGHRPRVAGQSKYGLWNRLGRGIYDLIGLAWYQKRRLGNIPVTELALVSKAPARSRQPIWRDIEVRTHAPELQPIEPA
ncbi:MAG TPA: glycosyltransferase family 2 protein [Methylomirabilota bacterium]|nr:glycosyltransferase family 2 protein [Methylomirabilota bacterium]